MIINSNLMEDISSFESRDFIDFYYQNYFIELFNGNHITNFRTSKTEGNDDTILNHDDYNSFFTWHSIYFDEKEDYTTSDHRWIFYITNLQDDYSILRNLYQKLA